MYSRRLNAALVELLVEMLNKNAEEVRSRSLPLWLKSSCQPQSSLHTHEVSCHIASNSIAPASIPFLLLILCYYCLLVSPVSLLYVEANDGAGSATPGRPGVAGR